MLGTGGVRGQAPEQHRAGAWAPYEPSSESRFSPPDGRDGVYEGALGPSGQRPLLRHQCMHPLADAGQSGGMSGGHVHARGYGRR